MLPIRKFMRHTDELVVLRTDMCLKEAARLMVTEDITGCPVLDEQNLLVGILSRTDLINQIAGRFKPVRLSFHPARSERYMQVVPHSCTRLPIVFL